LSTAERRFDMTGKVVVVTGASKGIGRELAMLLADAGAVVVPTVRGADDVDSLIGEAADRGLQLHPQLLDVRNAGAIDTALHKVVDQHGRIDVLVNNAGLGNAHAALEVTESDWDDMMSVNQRGVFFCSQAAARIMIEQGGGRIVNMSSEGGLVGLPDASVYCTSKGGVNMMTKVLALEWAKYSINVNAIAPTFVYTPGTAPILDEPAMKEQILAKIPLGMFAQTEDIAAAVIYLATPASRLVTGTVLVVDGGWTAQ